MFLYFFPWLLLQVIQNSEIGFFILLRICKFHTTVMAVMIHAILHEALAIMQENEKL